MKATGETKERKAL